MGAVVKPKPEKPIDPNSPEAIATKRIEADQAKSTVDQAEKKKVTDELAASDGQKIAADKAKKDQEAKEVRDRQEKAKEEALKKPLSPDEEVHYDSILRQARSGKPVDPTSMQLLGEYRTRLKNNGVANPD